ncbi:hypothetical protein [Mangrovibacillus cuniculi]|uniref:Uncharacterized protein n=1 Tax=Mangrovibacillus cuniculi TaxID=2593652 RepID=A0A7S8HH89_9BACI|nr:hypothetical protein [Mangrovibacillus cuniculi]QPC48230.1 hypothetical protein G8O30_15545 [Mangrovibacillus cuniculi]
MGQGVIISKLGSYYDELTNKMTQLSNTNSWDVNLDTRIQVFGKIANVLQYAQISYVFDVNTFAQMMKDQGQPNNKILSIAENYYSLVGWSSFLNVFSAIESSIRAIAKELSMDWKSPYYKLYNNLFTNVLGGTANSNYIRAMELFNICRVSRNTIHNNGVHVNQTETFSFLGGNYTFTEGSVVSFINWDFFFSMIGEIIIVLDLLVNSSGVASFSQIKDLRA